ncbi:MAG: hypothetical protein ABW252_06135 [Polyangiales bacterium]
MRRSRTRALGALLLALCAPASAHAQVALEQFTPAPLARDGFGFGGAGILDEGAYALFAATDYAHDPLVYKLTRGPRRQAAVAHHLVLHVGAAIGIHPRVMLRFDLPVHALMRGDRPLVLPRTAPDGAGLGDLLIGARVRLAGGPTSRLTVVTELLARLPTAELTQEGQRYAGDEFGSYEAALLGEARWSPVALRLRLGARFRAAADVQNLELGQMLVFAAGARANLASWVSLHVELSGATHLANTFERHHTPFELLLGAKLHHARGWFGAAAGPGLVYGYGAPDARVVVSGGAELGGPGRRASAE